MYRTRLKPFVFLCAGVAGLVVLYLLVLRFDQAYGSKLTEGGPNPNESSLIELVKDRPNTLRLTDQGMETVGLLTVEVEAGTRLSRSGCRAPCSLTRIAWSASTRTFRASWFP